MNTNEIDRIAAAVNALRPDWPVASIRALLNRPELVNRARRDIAVALTWVACESESKTPARVIEAGPWWKAANAEGTVAQLPPKREEACDTCGRRESEHAGLLADHDFRPVGFTAARTSEADNPGGWRGINQARAQLAAAQLDLCGHRVSKTKGRCTECGGETSKEMA